LYSAAIEFETKYTPKDPYRIGYDMADKYVYLMNKDHNKIERIPDIYKYNSKDVRLQVLGGIIDRIGFYEKSIDGYKIILQKGGVNADDIIYLTRSLGMECHVYNDIYRDMYYRIYICGMGVDDIPVKDNQSVIGKRWKSGDVIPLLRSFNIERVEDDDFYGFELDGNHRYLMGDFTVTHNSNGKSKIIELYQKCFGEYCCTLPIALLTQKRSSSSSATPELSRAKSRRFACLQEPGENERLNIGLMKEMTGGDKLYARGLYREGTEFKPQFKMILTCNHLPVVPSDDGGTWRRIRVVKFESRFCDNPDPNKPNEFPIDTDLPTRFDEWKEPFMSMLIDVYKVMVTSPKIREPEEVLECTREYQRRNDIIADFLDNMVERDDNSFLDISIAFLEFKAWLKEEGVFDKSIRKSDFQIYIDKIYGKCIKRNLVKGWSGFRMKTSVGNVDGDEYD
jgi:P4 family phage/plasmid primase-like protien